MALNPMVRTKVNGLSFVPEWQNMYDYLMEITLD